MSSLKDIVQMIRVNKHIDNIPDSNIRRNDIRRLAGPEGLRSFIIIYVNHYYVDRGDMSDFSGYPYIILLF